MTKIYQSDSINELASSLAKAQGEMKHAQKDANNPFFKSKYADLPAIIDAARQYLSKHGLSVTQCTDIGETGSVILMTQLSHSSGQWIRSWYPINPVKNDPQGMGSAITYARRYSYGAITGVAAGDEDDDGNAASGNIKPQTAIANKKKFEAIKKALQESKDPGVTWGENLAIINEFLEQDKTFYDDLVATGKARKDHLNQEQMYNAGSGQKDGIE